jgi:hypothetical protein
MSTSRNRPLIFIIAVLLLTNIAVLAYFLWYKNPSKPKIENSGKPKAKGIEAPLQNEVGFNEEQLVQYRQMRDEQMEALKPMFEDIKKAKESFFGLISSSNVADSTVNALADDIAQKQKAIDLRMYNHFKRIRGLCKPDQLPKYDTVVQRMMKKMSGGKQRKDRDKKG